MSNDAVVRAGVVIPIRSFVGAKERLAAHLDPDARARALRQMAEQVVGAAAPMPVFVVSSAPEVNAWAEALGLTVIPDPGSLDAAAAAGVDAVAAASLDRAVIAHADLPHARSLRDLATDDPAVVLVPCHRDDGTNVLSVPADAGFRFAYGPGSFARHVAEAERLGLEVRVLRAPDLMVDIDVAADLHHLGSTTGS